MSKAVVLLSGGLDSATVLYLARRQKQKVFGLSFDYGQRHARELTAARAIAGEAGCPLDVVRIGLPWKGSSLLDRSIAVPSGLSKRGRRPGDEIPSTYVPARNLIFLSFALSKAEAIGADTVFIGANAVDYSGYPDCRPEFYLAFVKAAAAGTRCGVRGRRIQIKAPLIRLSKAQIITLGIKLGVPYDKTWSCYKGGARPCGLCDSCCLRAKGFFEAGYEDPLTR